jgi:hypothetical protein
LFQVFWPDCLQQRGHFTGSEGDRNNFLRFFQNSFNRFRYYFHEERSANILEADFIATVFLKIFSVNQLSKNRGLTISAENITAIVFYKKLFASSSQGGW